MTLTEEQRAALKRVAAYMDEMYSVASPYHGCTEDSDLLRAMIDSGEHFSAITKLIPGFDLERIKADLGEIGDPRFCDCEVRTQLAAAIAEIERPRADLEQSEICIRARMECIDDQAAYIKELESSLDEAETLTKKNAELMNAYLARIAELEDALVEERAGAIRCEFYDHCEIDLPDAMIRARQELQADGKIGPGARPPCWQITEERKETLRRALEEYKIFPNDQAVLRAMLREAE
jgi:hypothetical protein